MNTDSTETTTPYSAMPPVAPPGLEPSPPGAGSSGWHKPIGIISIVLGVCGLIGGCSTALSTLWIPAFEEFTRNVMPAGQPTGMEGLADHSGSMIASGVLAIGAGALLIFAGIGTAKRRPWGPSLSVKWAIVKMIVVVATLLLSWPMQQASLQNMQQNAAGPQLSQGFYNAMLYGGLAFGLLWGWAYPIFILIWMLRAKVRAQIRDTWAAASH